MSPELPPETARTFLIVNTALLVSIGLQILLLPVKTPEKYRRFIQVFWNIYFKFSLIVPLCLILNSLMLIFSLYPHPTLINAKLWSGIGEGYILGFCLILSVITLFWWQSFNVERLIKLLRKKLEREYKKRSTLDYSSLNDLIDIGIYGEPDYEKMTVITNFGKLIQYVQKGHQKNKKYKGCELEPFLRNYDRILINNSSPGDDKNFKSSIDILENIFEHLKNENIEGSVDYKYSIELLTRIGKKVVEKCSHNICQEIIELSKNRAEILFSLGVRALKYNRFEVLKAIQNKLESLAERSSLEQNEETAYLLGMLSHIRKSESQSIRDLANSYLETNRSLFEPSLILCLKYARDFHERFDTRDNITDLIKEIQK